MYFAMHTWFIFQWKLNDSPPTFKSLPHFAIGLSVDGANVTSLIDKGPAQHDTKVSWEII